MDEFEKKLAEELATQIVSPAVMPLQAISEAITGHIKSWRWVHQGRFLNRKSEADIDRMVAESVNSIALRTEGIPQDRLQAPPLNIYGPVVEALSYNLESKELRDMFANILARFMDSESGNIPLPSYMEIIKQISSDEAKIINKLSDSLNPVEHLTGEPPAFFRYSVNGGLPIWPAVRVVRTSLDGKGQNVIMEGIVDLEIELDRKDLIPTYIANLERLGIVKLNHDAVVRYTGMGVRDGILVDISQDDPYSLLEPLAMDNYRGMFIADDDKYSVQKGSMQLTSLGIDFIFTAIFPNTGRIHRDFPTTPAEPTEGDNV